MLSLRRLITNRVCPTCNKVMHRSQITTHQRRHEAGRKGYENRMATTPVFTRRDVPDSDAMGTMPASVPNILSQ